MAIKAKIATQPTIKVEAGTRGKQGKDGVTFYPSVNENGDLSWTNDGGLSNPQTVNIKGANGKNYVITNEDKAEIAAIATENVVNDYAIRETIYLGLDGYCYSKDGIAYSINNLEIWDKETLSKYNFVLFLDGGATTLKSFVSLTTTWNDTEGSILFNAFVAEGFDNTYYLIFGHYNYGEEETIDFHVIDIIGNYLTNYYGVLSVDKEALLGDVETALDEIIGIKNSLIGGETT